MVLALSSLVLSLIAIRGEGAEQLPTILAGAHYFGGWFHCVPGDRSCLSDHFHGMQPTGARTDNWFPYYPSRVPLFGNLTEGLTAESTVAAELKAADAALDFFDVLYYGGGTDCGIPHGGDPNLRYCLDTTLAWMLNSTVVWEGISRLHFYITISNDIDAILGTSLVGPAGKSKWMSMLKTFTQAMKHPRYLKIGGRPVFNILSKTDFIRECGSNGTLVNLRLSQLRAAATAAGLQVPIVGNSESNPMTPAGVPSWAKYKEVDGYIRWNQTKVNCPGGCMIKTAQVHSVEQCQAICNRTAACQAITVNRGEPTSNCKLLDVTAPGTSAPTQDTYTRVPTRLSWDWTGTYGAVPVCHPPAGSSDWTCPEYKDSWWPNATQDGGKVFPYKQLGDWNTVSRLNHSQDLVPYLPNLMAGWDPRPWEEHAPSFQMPTEVEWESVVTAVVEQCQDPRNRFGWPDTTAPHGFQPAFEVYAWNEFAEGGILAPTHGQGYMKLRAIAKVLGRNGASARRKLDN